MVGVGGVLIDRVARYGFGVGESRAAENGRFEGRNVGAGRAPGGKAWERAARRKQVSQYEVYRVIRAV